MTKHKPEFAIRKCATCGKPHNNPEGFCCPWCKIQAQVRVWNKPMLDLPIKQRVPRLVPERLK